LSPRVGATSLRARRDNSGGAAFASPGLGREDAYGLAIEREFHFRLRQQARAFAYLRGNGHLTFGCDAHQASYM
jgi:hypothetical protein